MILQLLLVSHQKAYRQLLQDGVKRKEFGKAGRLKIGPTNSAAALKEMGTWGENTLLVLDAELPSTSRGQPDKAAYKPALELLNKRPNVKDGILPAIVIVPRTTPMSELDDYCNSANRAIALPFERLSDGRVLKAFVGMLARPSVPAWKVIELDVKDSSAQCQFRGDEGPPIEWGRASLANFLPPRELAEQFANFKICHGWSERLHEAGSRIFSNLLLPVIGAGLFSHLEEAAGGLGGLAFRFQVDQPELYTAPFEATVRRGRQDGGSFINRLIYSPFMLLHAPITRRISISRLRSAPITTRTKQPRMLFIRAQPGEHPGDETDFDLLNVQSADEVTGAPKSVQFDRLTNIDRERCLLAKLTGVTMDFLNLSVDRGKKKASETLKDYLKNKVFDVIHFARHSVTLQGATMLILPGEQSGEAEAMAADTFAALGSEAGARLVYLSSCEGSSASAVASFAQYDIPCVLGFRWAVNDASAADFAKAFYEALFHDHKTICLALRQACFDAYRPLSIESSAIWASPILASQWDDWSTRVL